MKTKLTILILFAFSYSGFSQEIIELKNPSFENPSMQESRHAQGEIPLPPKPYCCIAAKEWSGCGEPDLDTPDAQPGNFNVTLESIEGDHYIAMVTRDNETWESMSQQLKTPLVANQEYYFSLALATSDKLISESRTTGKIVKYNSPVKLRLWGSMKDCKKSELLGQSNLVYENSWKYSKFTIIPKKNYTHFTLEVFYKTPTPFPTNGNILIDDLSPIIPILPENETLISEIEESQNR